jgi:hypothetical protein
MLWVAVEAGPVPTPFVAVTVKVYDDPLLRPDTVHVVDDVVQVWFPTFEVTVYERIDVPPFDDGAVHVTDALPVPAVAAEAFVGAPGWVTGVNEFDALEAEPVPVPFVAVTVNV